MSTNYGVDEDCSVDDDFHLEADDMAAMFEDVSVDSMDFNQFESFDGSILTTNQLNSNSNPRINISTLERQGDIDSDLDSSESISVIGISDDSHYSDEQGDLEDHLTAENDMNHEYYDKRDEEDDDCNGNNEIPYPSMIEAVNPAENDSMKSIRNPDAKEAAITLQPADSGHNIEHNPLKVDEKETAAIPPTLERYSPSSDDEDEIPIDLFNIDQANISMDESKSSRPRASLLDSVLPCFSRLNAIFQNDGISITNMDSTDVIINQEER